MLKILVLGCSGMLGSSVYKFFSNHSEYVVHGTVRSKGGVTKYFSNKEISGLIDGVDVCNFDSLARAFIVARPTVVINCVGMVKQLIQSNDALSSIAINSELPHRLATLCLMSGARLIHVSTDCVFSGHKGNYSETDPADAEDLYGRSKLLGEVAYPHTITLRTSIIGHELQSSHGLVSWFLFQQERCNGYTKAIFSGLPTVVLAQIIRDKVIPCAGLSGVYHVAAQPISKYDLLKVIADVYGKTIEIVPSDQLMIDRSLNSDRFRLATGYIAPSWPDLIKLMHAHK